VVTKHHWPNWRRSAERFAFAVAVQLCAATRDFPMHDHLHASQTPKGCSFTEATAAAVAAAAIGVGSHIGWVAVDDSGSDAATTVGGGSDYTYNATVKRGGLGYTLRLLQNKHTTWTSRIVSWLEACLEIGYMLHTRIVQVIVGVSADRCQSADGA